jgi:hypothetical protein
MLISVLCGPVLVCNYIRFTCLFAFTVILILFTVTTLWTCPILFCNDLRMKYNTIQMMVSLKLWTNFKILCQKCIKTVSNKDQSTPILRNSKNKHRSKFDKHEHFWGAFWLLIVLHYVIGVYKINNEKMSI